MTEYIPVDFAKASELLLFWRSAKQARPGREASTDSRTYRSFYDMPPMFQSAKRHRQALTLGKQVMIEAGLWMPG